jgi:hypothetical protein
VERRKGERHGVGRHGVHLGSFDRLLAQIQ